MFFIIWGFRTTQRRLAVLSLACVQGHVAAHSMTKVVRKFTLFFIPLFPVRTRYVTVCTMCGQQQQWDKADAEAAIAGAQAAGAGVPAPSPDPVAPPVNPYQPVPAGMPAGHRAPAHPAGHQLAPVPAPSVPAGWYPDPAGSPQQRWWDGKGWTQDLR